MEQNIEFDEVHVDYIKYINDNVNDLNLYENESKFFYYIDAVRKFNKFYPAERKTKTFNVVKEYCQSLIEAENRGLI